MEPYYSRSQEAPKGKTKAKQPLIKKVKSCAAKIFRKVNNLERIIISTGATMTAALNAEEKL